MSDLVRLSQDDFTSFSQSDIGSSLYYVYLYAIFEYRIKAVSPKRVTLVTNADEIHPRRYMTATNYFRWFKVKPE